MLIFGCFYAKYAEDIQKLTVIISIIVFFTLIFVIGWVVCYYQGWYRYTDGKYSTSDRSYYKTVYTEGRCLLHSIQIFEDLSLKNNSHDDNYRLAVSNRFCDIDGTCTNVIINTKHDTYSNNYHKLLKVYDKYALPGSPIKDGYFRFEIDSIIHCYSKMKVHRYNKNIEKIEYHLGDYPMQYKGSHYEQLFFMPILTILSFFAIIMFAFVICMVLQICYMYITCSEYR
jgi:hypothetical protein